MKNVKCVETITGTVMQNLSGQKTNTAAGEVLSHPSLIRKYVEGQGSFGEDHVGLSFELGRALPGHKDIDYTGSGT